MPTATLADVTLEYQARRAVGRGAAVLDDVYPTWYEVIDIEELDTSDPNTCIAGQIAEAREPGSLGGPWNQIIQIALEGADRALIGEIQDAPEAWGFDTEALFPYSELTALWLDEIYERLPSPVDPYVFEFKGQS